MRSFTNRSLLALSASTVAIIVGTPAFAETQAAVQQQNTTVDCTTVTDQTAHAKCIADQLQTAPTATPAAKAGETEIYVTGSRIKRPEFTNPNPTQSYSSQSLQERGATNI